MSREREPARVVTWRGKWYLFYYDHKVERPRRRRLTKAEQRNEQTRRDCQKQARIDELGDAEEARRRGGRLAYDTPLKNAIDVYRKHLTQRVEARAANPDARDGIAVSTGKEIGTTLDLFESWLGKGRRAKLTTGELDVRTLRAFFTHLASQPSRHGKKRIMRSASTLNKHRRHIGALLSGLDEIRPPLFPDSRIFKTALKPLRTSPKGPVAFRPDELAAFLDVAIQYEQPARLVEVTRTKPSGAKEHFLQRVGSRQATPVSRLFLLLALTGCRLGEALQLKWESVDLEVGRITYHALKTGRSRCVPISGGPEGDVAPLLLALLRQWKEEDDAREFVLPHEGLVAPVFPQGAWQRVNKRAKLRRIGPQLLRENFCSYGCSLGIPATTVAGWQGHQARVAEAYYRAQVLERNPGKTFEAAMGLQSHLIRLVEEPRTVPRPAPLRLVKSEKGAM